MRASGKRFVIVLGVLVLLTALAFAACDDEGGGGDEGTTVDVILSEWVVDPDVTSVPAGEVTFTANNDGVEDHELVVVKTDLSADALPVDDTGKVDEEGEGIEVIGEIEEFAAGDSEEATFNLAAGSYVLFCNIVEEEASGEKESHYQEGMHAAFTVK